MNEGANTGSEAGSALANWTARPRPPRTPMVGRLVQVESFSLAHVPGLYAAFAEDAEGRIWRYLPYGPFESEAAFSAHAERTMLGDEPLFHAIVDRASEQPLGVAALLRIVPEHGVIEVGHIAYSPRLQRTAASTEAMYLLARRVFDELGYRRYEWKCNDRNAASKAAARRLGFVFEGTFRQHMVVKDENRDTAWFSIVDREWRPIRSALEAWLDPGNFDAAGAQKRRLGAFLQRL